MELDDEQRARRMTGCLFSIVVWMLLMAMEVGLLIGLESESGDALRSAVVALLTGAFLLGSALTIPYPTRPVGLAILGGAAASAVTSAVLVIAVVYVVLASIA